MEGPLDTLGDMFTYKEWIKQKDSNTEPEPIVTKKKDTPSKMKPKAKRGAKPNLQTRKSRRLNNSHNGDRMVIHNDHNDDSGGRMDEPTKGRNDDKDAHDDHPDPPLDHTHPVDLEGIPDDAEGFTEYVQSIEKCTSITRLFSPRLADVLEAARKKGFEPRTLADVLYERKKLWAKTQCIHSSAKEDFLQHTQLYRKQFWGYKKSVDGWITESKNSTLEGLYGTREKKSGKIWSNVIYCPNFKPGGEVIHRFSRKTSRTYKTLYDCIVDGWVHPDLVVCEIIDATHPVRFATPPEQDCYTAIYVGPEISEDSPRVIFGEYTGIVYHEDSIEDSVFEYAFELNFAAGSWINADYADTEEMVHPAYRNNGQNGHDGPLDGHSAHYGSSGGVNVQGESYHSTEGAEGHHCRNGEFTHNILEPGESRSVHDTDFAYTPHGILEPMEASSELHFPSDDELQSIDGSSTIDGFLDLDLIPIGGTVDDVPVKGCRGARPKDCVYLPSSSRYVLDSTTACNELSLVNHCQTISAYGGEFWTQPNCEWQQVIFDGWPHIVLTSKEGVKISPGDELVADFGALWFAKVEETAHKSLRREVIEYRTGIRSKVAKRQTVLQSRPVEDIDRWIVNTGHFGTQFTCAICNDEYDASERNDHNGPKNDDFGVRTNGHSDAHNGPNGVRNDECPIPSIDGHDAHSGHHDDHRESMGSGDRMDGMGSTNVGGDEASGGRMDEENAEECISCDGCDRVFHLSCIKNLSGTAANVFAKEEGVIVWKTDRDPFKADRAYALGKWFCMYCRYLAKQIYMHDIGADYMPISKAIGALPNGEKMNGHDGQVDAPSSMAPYGRHYGHHTHHASHSGHNSGTVVSRNVRPKGGVITTHGQKGRVLLKSERGNVKESIDVSVQTSEEVGAACKKPKHVRTKRNVQITLASSGLISYLHKTYIKHESNNSGSEFDRIMHKIFKRHKMHKMKTMERFSPLQLTKELMRSGPSPEWVKMSMEWEGHTQVANTHDAQNGPHGRRNDAHDGHNVDQPEAHSDKHDGKLPDTHSVKHNGKLSDTHSVKHGKPSESLGKKRESSDTSTRTHSGKSGCLPDTHNGHNVDPSETQPTRQNRRSARLNPSISSTKTPSLDDTPTTRAFTPINRRDRSASLDPSLAPTYREDEWLDRRENDGMQTTVGGMDVHNDHHNDHHGDKNEHSEEFLSETGFLAEQIKRVEVGSFSEDRDGFSTYLARGAKAAHSGHPSGPHSSGPIHTPIIHTDMNLYNDVGVTDYLTCRHLFGMWQLESFSLFGDTVKVCSECNQRSGPRANVYVCRILKRHLGGNYDHPESINVAQMREYVLMAYEQHVHFLLRLLVLKNISIHYLVRTCCHFIGKQLLYNKDLTFSESEILEAINPSLINVKGLVSKTLAQKAVKRDSKGKPLEEDPSDVMLIKLMDFLSGITNTILKTPKFDGLFNYGLLKAMGAFTEEYTRVINCDEIVRYINDLTTYISYDGDQIPGHLHQMLNKAEMERFSNFRHLSQKTSSPFSDNKTHKFSKKKERIVFVPLLGIVPGRSLVYRKFSDGYYQGTVTAHDVHRGVHISFKIEYSDGDDEIMHPEELMEEILLNIGDSERILRELSENDSRNEHFLSRLGELPDIPTIKRLAGKLRKTIIKSLMPPKLGAQKRQSRL